MKYFTKKTKENEKVYLLFFTVNNVLGKAAALLLLCPDLFGELMLMEFNSFKYYVCCVETSDISLS